MIEWVCRHIVCHHACLRGNWGARRREQLGPPSGIPHLPWERRTGRTLEGQQPCVGWSVGEWRPGKVCQLPFTDGGRHAIVLRMWGEIPGRGTLGPEAFLSCRAVLLQVGRGLSSATLSDRGLHKPGECAWAAAAAATRFESPTGGLASPSPNDKSPSGLTDTTRSTQRDGCKVSTVKMLASVTER